MAAARPTLVRTVDVGSCRACFPASFAALGFFGVFCREDMLPSLTLSSILLELLKAEIKGYREEQCRTGSRRQMSQVCERFGPHSRRNQFDLRSDNVKSRTRQEEVRDEENKVDQESQLFLAKCLMHG